MLHNHLTFEIKENNFEIKSPVICTIVKFCCTIVRLCCTIVSCRCTIAIVSLHCTIDSVSMVADASDSETLFNNLMSQLTSLRPCMHLGTNVVHSLIEDNTGSIFSKTLFVDFRTEGVINDYGTL